MTDQLIADLERAEAILLDLTDGSANKATHYADVCRRAAERLRELEAEVKGLKHDIDSFMEIANTELNRAEAAEAEVERLRAELQCRIDKPVDRLAEFLHMKAERDELRDRVQEIECLLNNSNEACGRCEGLKFAVECADATLRREQDRHTQTMQALEAAEQEASYMSKWFANELKLPIDKIITNVSNVYDQSGLEWKNRAEAAEAKLRAVEGLPEKWMKEIVPVPGKAWQVGENIARKDCADELKSRLRGEQR